MEDLRKVIPSIKEKMDLKTAFEEKGIELKGAGINKYKARCPFHVEKTPSLVIFEDSQTYHCFGCGESGDVISFYSKMDVLSFKETVYYLSQKLGIDIDNESLDVLKTSLRKMKVLSDLNSLFKKKFQNLDENHPAKLNVRERGLSDKEDWYGWAPKNSKEILNKLIAMGHSIEDMNDVGILNKNNSLFFFNRLIFTINNYMGKPIAFSGRQIEDDGFGKYINSPNSEVFNKSTILYNLDKAKNQAQKENRIYITEGYFDVIAMSEKGYTNTVATCGTAFTKEHTKVLLNLMKNGEIIFIMDGDKAGLKSMFKVFTDFPEIHENARVIILPNQKDPCEYLSEQDSLPESSPILAWVYEIFRRKTKDKSPEEIVRLSEVAYDEFTAKIENSYLRSEYENKIKSWAGVQPKSFKGKVHHEEFKKKNSILEMMSLLIHNYSILKDVYDKDDFPVEYQEFIEKCLDGGSGLSDKDYSNYQKILNNSSFIEEEEQVICQYNYLKKFNNKKRR